MTNASQIMTNGSLIMTNGSQFMTNGSQINKYILMLTCITFSEQWKTINTTKGTQRGSVCSSWWLP